MNIVLASVELFTKQFYFEIVVKTPSPSPTGTVLFETLQNLFQILEFQERL
jgi:hypothetical protein